MKILRNETVIEETDAGPILTAHWLFFRIYRQFWQGRMHIIWTVQKGEMLNYIWLGGYNT